MAEKRNERKNPAVAAAGAVEKLVKGVGSVIGVTPKTAEKQKLPNRTKVLVSIVNHDDEKRLKEILDDTSVALSFMFAGTGTARSAVLDYLGIGGTEKSVILSLIPESDEENIMRELRARMSLYLVGRGISFTIPLSAVSQIVSNGLESAAAEKTIDGSKIMKDEQRQYDLIIAAVAANTTPWKRRALRELRAAPSCAAAPQATRKRNSSSAFPSCTSRNFSLSSRRARGNSPSCRRFPKKSA